MNNQVQDGLGGIIGAAISFSGLTLEDADHIFSIVCGVIGVVITIITCVIIPVARKVIAARKDGHIDIDEVEDIVNTVEKGVKDAQDQLNHDK